MRRPILILATLLAALPAGAETAADLVHLRVGRAHELAHRAEDAWQASRTESSEALRLDVLAFAGAARLAAARLSDHDCPAAEGSELLSSLRALANRAQTSFDRTRTSSVTRDAWAEARRALAALEDPGLAQGPAGGTGSTSTTTPPPPPAPETPADPDAPRADITETRWSGTFTPDLVVSGRVEGRGLRSGFLAVRDARGREIHRAEREIADAIAAATQGGPADALATATFSVRIDDDQLATGENVIVLIVTDSMGRTAETTKSITKRLF